MYQPISELMVQYKEVLPKPEKKKRNSERGDLLQYFVEKINSSTNRGKPTTIPYLAMRLQGFQMKDLYYIKSICDGAEKEKGEPWAKIFFGSIKTKPNGQ